MKHQYNKRSFCAIILVMLPWWGSAQNYLNYFRGIATAESMLTEGHYSQALRIYDSVFTVYAFSQPWDCYVSTQLAAYMGDNAHCTQLLKRGIVSGIPLTVLHKNPRLNVKVGVDPLSHQVIDSCLRVYEARINPEARMQALTMARADQRLIYDPALTKGSIYTADGYTLKPELRPIWDSLVQELIRITKTYGFPAERIVGTHAMSDSLFPEGTTTRYGWPLLVHHGMAWPVLQQMLFQELQRGNISPRLYGAIADHSDSVNGSELPYMALWSCTYFVKGKACQRKVAAHLQSINASRAEIGLCTYETMEKKEALKRGYLKWIKDGAEGNPPVFDFIGVGWEPGTTQ